MENENMNPEQPTNEMQNENPFMNQAPVVDAPVMNGVPEAVETPAMPEVAEPVPAVETPVMPEVVEPTPVVETPAMPEVVEPTPVMPEMPTTVAPEVNAEPAPAMPEVANPIPDPITGNTVAPEKKKTSPVVWVVLIVVVIAAVLLAIKPWETKKPADTPVNDQPKVEEKKQPVEEKDALTKFVEENRSSVTTLSTDQYSVDLLARDGSLVYSFKYLVQIPADAVADVKKSLDEGLASNRGTYINVLNSVKLVAPDTKSVIVEYLNIDGTIISSMEFN